MLQHRVSELRAILEAEEPALRELTQAGQALEAHLCALNKHQLELHADARAKKARLAQHGDTMVCYIYMFLTSLFPSIVADWF